jgi:hypothetical protein
VQDLGAPVEISGVDDDHTVTESASSGSDGFRVVDQQVDSEGRRKLHTRGELGAAFAVQPAPPSVVRCLVHDVSEHDPVRPEVEPDPGTRSVGAGVDADLVPGAGQLPEQLNGPDPQRLRAQRRPDASRRCRSHRLTAGHEGVIQVEGDAHHRETIAWHRSFPVLRIVSDRGAELA